jgi:hypothetical protein
MFCEKCGNQLLEGQYICPNCSDSNKVESENDYGDGYEMTVDMKMGRDTPQTLNGITLSNEEFAVRTYRCSQLKFPSCTGYLSVTNRRVLFHGYGGSSRIVDEVPLDSVSGISTLYGGKLLVGRLIAGIILTIASLVIFTIAQDEWGDPSPMSIGIAILALIIGVALLATCYRKTFVLKIYSSKANNSPIDIGSGAGGSIGSSALFTVVAYPTGQTGKMMLELGAMINDLQNMGDYGVERWKN